MTKSPWRVSLLAGLAIGGLLACTSTPAADSGRAALRAAIDRWFDAVNSRDVAMLTATMTEDVELSDSRASVRGRDAAIRALREVVKDGTLGGVTFEITVANDVAWHEIGLTQTRKNGDVQGRGLALEIWKRVDGEWKLHRRLATGVTAPDIQLTRPTTKEPVLDQSKN